MNLNKIRPGKSSMIIHLIIGVIFSGLSIYVLVRQGFGILSSGYISSYPNYRGYRDIGGAGCALIVFLVAAGFGWWGFAEDLKFLRKKNAEAPEESQLSSPDPTPRRRKERRSRRS